jgi:hypothetical protein
MDKRNSLRTPKSSTTNDYYKHYWRYFIDLVEMSIFHAKEQASSLTSPYESG